MMVWLSTNMLDTLSTLQRDVLSHFALCTVVSVFEQFPLGTGICFQLSGYCTSSPDTVLALNIVFSGLNCREHKVHFPGL